MRCRPACGNGRPGPTRREQDNLAQQREVVLLDNRGVGGSSGAVPDHVTDMARDVGTFVDALGLKQVDILVSADTLPVIWAE